MNLRRLEHFVMLAELGSFVRAAEKLHLTQSALSHSIRTLEEELGLPLLDRSRSGTRPTPAGEQLLKDARGVLRQATTMRRNLQALARREAGDVRFGFAPLPAHLWLSGILQVLVRDHGGVAASASVGAGSELLAMLEGEAIEFFVGAREPLTLSNEFAVLPLARLPLTLVTRLDHPLQRRAALTPEDLDRFPLACIATDPIAADDAYAPLFRSGRITVQCDDCGVLRDLALHSDVVWLASSAVARNAGGPLAPLAARLEGMPDAIELVVVAHAGRTLSPAATLVIETARVLAATP